MALSHPTHNNVLCSKIVKRYEFYWELIGQLGFENLLKRRGRDPEVSLILFASIPLIRTVHQLTTPLRHCVAVVPSRHQPGSGRRETVSQTTPRQSPSDCRHAGRQLKTFADTNATRSSADVRHHHFVAACVRSAAAISDSWNPLTNFDGHWHGWLRP